MKFLNFAIIALLSFPFAIQAQKLDIDGKKIKATFLRLPETPLPSTTKTYSVKFEGGHNVNPWGFDLEAVKEEFFTLYGFEKVENGGDLTLEVKMSPIRFLDSRINNSKTENKDSKTGKVTTTYRYWYELTYEKGFAAKLMDKDGKVLWDYNKGIGGLMRSSTDNYKSSEFGTYKEASDAYSNNRVNVQRDIAGNNIRSNFGSIKSAVNKEYGYAPVTETFSIWTTDSEKHPENAAFKKAAEECKAYFEALEADNLTESSVSGLAQVADYFKATAEKYKSEEKIDRKLRYACYYNLAITSLYLDRPDETLLWAAKIVENEHEKKDAKELTKDAEALKALLAKHKVTSRRFKRV